MPARNGGGQHALTSEVSTVIPERRHARIPVVPRAGC
jgi:hypothetical protein